MNEETMQGYIARYIDDPSEESLEKAVPALGEFLYTHLKKYKLNIKNDDTRGDYIAWLYPKLPKIIRRFNPEKASFATYINWIVRLTFRTFCRGRYGQEACQLVYQTEEETRLMSIMAEQVCTGNWDQYGPSAETNAPDEKPLTGKSRTVKRRELEARRLLLLACKAQHLLDDRDIARISRMSGFSVDYITRKLDMIRQKGLLACERLRTAREKEFSFYLRAQRCRFEMKDMEKDCTRYLYLEREYRYCIRRMRDLRARISRQMVAPSNRFLASTFGYCRGTVDSTLASAQNHGYSDSS